MLLYTSETEALPSSLVTTYPRAPFQGGGCVWRFPFRSRVPNRNGEGHLLNGETMLL